MSKTARSTNAMKICLSILWEVKVDYDIDGLDVDTTSEKIGADEIATDAVTEVVKNTVAVGLEHASMTVEAGVAKFGNLLGQEFDTVGGVTEDDRLIDL